MKTGRPKTGNKKYIHVSVTHDTKKRVIEFAKKDGRSIISAFNKLIEIGLDKIENRSNG